MTFEELKNKEHKFEKPVNSTEDLLVSFLSIEGSVFAFCAIIDRATRRKISGEIVHKCKLRCSSTGIPYFEYRSRNYRDRFSKCDFTEVIN